MKYYPTESETVCLIDSNIISVTLNSAHHYLSVRKKKQNMDARMKSQQSVVVSEKMVEQLGLQISILLGSYYIKSRQ